MKSVKPEFFSDTPTLQHTYIEFISGSVDVERRDWFIYDGGAVSVSFTNGLDFCVGAHEVLNPSTWFGVGQDLRNIIEEMSQEDQ